MRHSQDFLLFLVCCRQTARQETTESQRKIKQGKNKRRNNRWHKKKPNTRQKTEHNTKKNTIQKER